MGSERGNAFLSGVLATIAVAGAVIALKAAWTQSVAPLIMGCVGLVVGVVLGLVAWHAEADS